MLRLKGGDPFVFGRGWDEAAALTEAGIRFRIIPGLTSGLAGGGARRHSGHVARHQPCRDPGRRPSRARMESRRRIGRRWPKLGQPIILYMPMAQLADITAALQRGGMPPDTPAAIIQGASTAEERVVESSLARLADDARARRHRRARDRRHRQDRRTAAGHAVVDGRLAMTQAVGPGGLVVAAPRSGAGKTTVALGLMRALRRRGLAVQPFKCGPDYIDPAFHAVAAGRPSYNLDTWAMAAGTLADLVARHAIGADMAVAEGVMGLFDGVADPGQTARGATADLAALFGWPVVLVLDVSGQTETAAAVAAGCAHYRDDVGVAGVILNRVSSARHLALIAPAFERDRPESVRRHRQR